MTTADWVIVAAVVVAAIALALIYWRWPAAAASRRRDPRATTFRRRGARTTRRRLEWGATRRSRSSRDVSTPAIRANWSTPPYDWERRPGGRATVGLPTPAVNAARAAARRDLGFIRNPT